MTYPIDLVLDRLEAVRRSGDDGNQWTACCPTHDDTHQSLSIGVDKEGVVLLWCHAGCQTPNVVAALGLTFADLKPESARRDVLPFTRSAAKKTKKSDPPKSTKSLEKLLAECEADPHCVRGVQRYADHIGVPFQALWDLGCRWKRIEIYPKNPLDPGELWYPERDGSGKVIGIGIRSWNGDKCSVTGGRRGIIFPADVLSRSGPIYLVEGLTDTAAILAIGACVVGRPSNTGGVIYLADFLSQIDPDREIIFVGENDKKLDGDWPGRYGAEHSAEQLAEILNRPVKAALLLEQFKDSREWYLSLAVFPDNDTASVYYRNLTIFSTFPHPYEEVTDEELLAASIPMSNTSPYAHPDELCHNTRHFLLQHLQTYKLRHCLTRCGTSSCPECFKRKKRLRYESLCNHFDSLQLKNGELHCSTRQLSKKEWDSIRRGINRHDGDYSAFPQPFDLIVIIATVPFAGSEPLPFDQAKYVLKAAIDNAIILGPRKPFFRSSKRWAMAREEKNSSYKKLGIVRMPPQAVRMLIHQKLGMSKYKEKRPADSSILIDGYIDYAAPDPQNDVLVSALLAKDGMSELLAFTTNDSDNSLPAESTFLGLPPWIDEYFAWSMNPTG